MSWIQIVGMVVCVVVLLAVLRQYNPTYAVAAGLASCGMLLIVTLSAMTPLLEYLSQLARILSDAQLQVLAKAAGIALTAQLARDVCKDAGQSALAGQVELAGRVLILLAAMPLFGQLLQLVTGLLQ